MKTGRVVAVVQARMSSSRLPGKVLADLGETSVLELLLTRLLKARELQAVAVATSTEGADDPVAATAEAMSVPVVRGPLNDVLERYRMAGEELGCHAITRITGDCPFIDPAVVDRVIEKWRQGGADYVANCIEPRTFPHGLDTEVVAWDALLTAANEATAPFDREHVTPYIRARPRRFPPLSVELDPPHPELRLELNTAEDLRFLRELLERVGPTADLHRILAAVDS